MAVVAGRHGGADLGRGSRDRREAPARVERSARAVGQAGPAAHFHHLAQIADGVVLLLAFPLAYVAKTRLLPADLTRLYDPAVYFGPAALVALATLVLLERRGAYRTANFLRVARMVRTIVLCIAQALAIAATVLFLFKLSYVSRLFILLYATCAVSLLVLVRLGFRRVAARLRASGAGAARVLLVGRGEEARRLEEVLAEEAPFGVAVVARLPVERVRALAGGEAAWSPQAGAPSIPELLSREAVDEVAIASDVLSSGELGRLIEDCDREGVVVHVVTDALGAGLERATLEQVGELRLLSVNPQEHWPWGRAVKRALDLVVTPLLLALLSPLFLLVAIAIKLDSPGPVFFMQERLGLNKRRFRMIKFRSMFEGSEHLRPLLLPLNEADGPIFKLRRDPRVTRVGRALRRFDLDELPQLLNVLAGDMSLIGPRPMLATEITGFEPWQRKRFSMPPGITGLWQVSNRLGQPFLSGLAADLEYIDRWSLKLDFQILLRTLPAILRNRVAP